MLILRFLNCHNPQLTSSLENSFVYIPGSSIRGQMRKSWENYSVNIEKGCHINKEELIEAGHSPLNKSVRIKPFFNQGELLCLKNWNIGTVTLAVSRIVLAQLMGDRTVKKISKSLFLTVSRKTKEIFVLWLRNKRLSVGNKIKVKAQEVASLIINFLLSQLFYKRRDINRTKHGFISLSGVPP